MSDLAPRFSRTDQYRPLRSPSGSKSGAAAGPGRILLVEDDYYVALELEQRLREAGFEVVGIAGAADEALRLAESKKPELAIMDIRLRGDRDGIDAAIDLLTKVGVRSIFASAHGDRETRRGAQAAEPLGWLEKPYSADTLIAAVKTALAKE